VKYTVITNTFHLDPCETCFLRNWWSFPAWFMRPHNWYQSWAWFIHPTISYHMPLQSILLLFLICAYTSWAVPFLQVLPQEHIMHISYPPICAIYAAHLKPSPFDHIKTLYALFFSSTLSHSLFIHPPQFIHLSNFWQVIQIMKQVFFSFMLRSSP